MRSPALNPTFFTISTRRAAPYQFSSDNILRSTLSEAQRRGFTRFARRVPRSPPDARGPRSDRARAADPHREPGEVELAIARRNAFRNVRLRRRPATALDPRRRLERVAQPVRAVEHVAGERPRGRLGEHLIDERR